jgi:hypothetical protein
MSRRLGVYSTCFSQALESEIVSCQLHQWIDLIFGYKQKGMWGMNFSCFLFFRFVYYFCVWLCMYYYYWETSSTIMRVGEGRIWFRFWGCRRLSSQESRRPVRRVRVATPARFICRRWVELSHPPTFPLLPTGYLARGQLIRRHVYVYVFFLSNNKYNK